MKKPPIPTTLTLELAELVGYLLDRSNPFTGTGLYAPRLVCKELAQRLRSAPSASTTLHLEPNGDGTFMLWRWQDWKEAEPRRMAIQQQSALDRINNAHMLEARDIARSVWLRNNIARQMGERLATQTFNLFFEAWLRNREDPVAKEFLHSNSFFHHYQPLTTPHHD